MPAIHRKTAVKSDDLSEVEEDFAILAQLAASESPDAVRLLLAKMVRKYRMSHPILAGRFGEALRATPTRSASPKRLARTGCDILYLRTILASSRRTASGDSEAASCAKMAKSSSNPERSSFFIAVFLWIMGIYVFR